MRCLDGQNARVLKGQCDIGRQLRAKKRKALFLCRLSKAKQRAVIRNRAHLQRQEQSPARSHAAEHPKACSDFRRVCREARSDADCSSQTRRIDGIDPQIILAEIHIAAAVQRAFRPKPGAVGTNFARCEPAITQVAGKRVDIGTDAISVRMRIDGLAELAQELMQSAEDKDAAA